MDPSGAADAFTIDLLDYSIYAELLSHPDRLEPIIAASHKTTIIIDEIQRVPALLDEVHRLIEKRRWRFALTGSSARKLRRGGVNLLAGRALTLSMHPLTAAELGDHFDIARSVRVGHLPTAQTAEDLASLRLFKKDYPMARCHLLYGGTRAYEVEGIRVLPLASALPDLPKLLDT